MGANHDLRRGRASLRFFATFQGLPGAACGEYNGSECRYRGGENGSFRCLSFGFAC
ncbi:hypothetical protein [Actinomyces sp.]|uniref:hypothetical protein n=1 Tax=Actinomyces sp. TaxID=29317 RepID=UPI0037BECE49